MWGIILKYVKVVFILEWVFFCLVDDNEIIYYLINIFFFLLLVINILFVFFMVIKYLDWIMNEIGYYGLL